MTLFEVGASCPVVVARASVECRINSKILARIHQRERSRCHQKHRQDHPMCAFHDEGHAMRPTTQLTDGVPSVPPELPTGVTRPPFSGAHGSAITVRTSRAVDTIVASSSDAYFLRSYPS